MIAQRSAFTVMGDSFLTLDQQFPKLVADGLLVKLELPPETYDDTEDYLNLAGCSAFTFFPDLDGLAKRQKAEVAAQMREARKYYSEHLKGNAE